jgi:prepilin-type N-terminal cleavage/methylation domain-containing protein
MIRCAPLRHGAPGVPGNGGAAASGAFRHGFTLLEMCMVLFIIALLVALTVPSMESALTEQAVRRDSHQLALMVKTAMIQSAEQHRPYVIDLTSTSMALHPLGEAAADPDLTDASAGDDDTANTSGPVDVDVTSNLDPLNKLVIPDPVKPDVWITADGTEWTFQPGELCQAIRIRLTRGEAWEEMSFNALTGNVEDESIYIP